MADVQTHDHRQGKYPISILCPRLLETRQSWTSEFTLALASHEDRYIKRCVLQPFFWLTLLTPGTILLRHNNHCPYPFTSELQSLQRPKLPVSTSHSKTWNFLNPSQTQGTTTGIALAACLPSSTVLPPLFSFFDSNFSYSKLISGLYHNSIFFLSSVGRKYVGLCIVVSPTSNFRVPLFSFS